MFPFFTFLGRIIPSYGLCLVLGIVVSCFLAVIRAKKINMDTNNLIVIAATSVGCGLICAKLLYIAVTFSFVEILNMIKNGSLDFIVQGGLVYYGGLIGGIIAAYITTILLKEDIDKVIITVVPCIPLGHAFGRLGCLLAGCCYGSEYNGAFAVILNINGVAVSTFPIQAVESILNLFLCFGLICICKKIRRKSLLLMVYLYMYSVMRFFLEYFRGDLVRGVFLGLSTSQWICIAVAFICTMYTVIFSVIKRRSQV